MLEIPVKEYKIVPSAKEVWPITFAKLEEMLIVLDEI